MFKWILIIILIALGAWIFAPNVIPPDIKFSTAGTYLNSAIFNMEYDLLLKKKEAEPKIKATEVSESKFESLFASLQKSKSRAVIFFYNSSCFYCRGFIKDINDMIEKHKAAGDKSLYYVMVAFDDDNKKINTLLSNNYNNLAFKPLIMKSADISLVQNLFSEKKILFSRVPVLIYRNADGGYEVFQTDSWSFDKIAKKIDDRS